MTFAAIVLLCLAVLGAIAVAMWTNRGAATAEAQTEVAAGPSDSYAVVTVDAAAAPYPVYRYSVIPGGAHNRAELVDAINRDGVVADHYRTVSLDRVRAERLTEARQAYVSYRVNDRVYWTKHKVTVPAGEAILTDGTITIRARCGNCIADEPQLPTSAAEPPVAELDAVAPAIPALLPSLARAPGIGPGLPDQSAALPPGSSRSLGPLVPVIPFGLASAGGAQKRSPAQVASSPELADLAASLSDPEHQNTVGSVPGGLTPVGLGRGGPRIGELFPGEFIPGTLIPQTLPDGSSPPLGDDWTREVPEQPAPIPEPSTIVLLGTGLAGAMWRGVRSRLRR